MKLTWLGQSGLLFEDGRITVIVDPYLSDTTPAGKRRNYTADESYLSIEPDVILITHAHPDHLDADTLARYLSEQRKCVTVLCSASAYGRLTEIGAPKHNYVLLSPHTVWSESGVTFYSVKAEHSDRDAVGFIIDDGEKTYYISGDTLYNFDVIDDCLDLVEDGVDYAFLPINGRGNNMNAKDASDFAYELGAKCAVPVHYGLLDDVDPEDFDFDDRMIISPFEAHEL